MRNPTATDRQAKVWVLHVALIHHMYDCGDILKLPPGKVLLLGGTHKMETGLIVCTEIVPIKTIFPFPLRGGVGPA